MLFQSADESTDDPEQAYLLYSRCVQICNLILGCSDFKEFSKCDVSSILLAKSLFQEATHFRKIVTHSLKEFDRLENQLKDLYASIEAKMAERKTEPKPTEQPTEQQIEQPEENEVHPVDRKGNI